MEDEKRNEYGVKVIEPGKKLTDLIREIPMGEIRAIPIVSITDKDLPWDKAVDQAKNRINSVLKPLKDEGRCYSLNLKMPYYHLSYHGIEVHEEPQHAAGSTNLVNNA